MAELDRRICTLALKVLEVYTPAISTHRIPNATGGAAVRQLVRDSADARRRTRPAEGAAPAAARTFPCSVGRRAKRCAPAERDLAALDADLQGRLAANTSTVNSALATVAAEVRKRRGRKRTAQPSVEAGRGRGPVVHLHRGTTADVKYIDEQDDREELTGGVTPEHPPGAQPACDHAALSQPGCRSACSFATVTFAPTMSLTSAGPFVNSAGRFAKEAFSKRHEVRVPACSRCPAVHTLRSVKWNRPSRGC